MIEIDMEKCTSCRACWEVCPNFVLRPVEEAGRTVPSVAHPDLCNECGQCMAFCKPEAVLNDRFMYADYREAGPCDVQTDSLKDLLMSRRSVRRYLDRDVPEDLIEQLLEVAVHAGTGSNSQSVGFVVIRDSELLRRLEKVVLDMGWSGLKHLEREGVVRALKVVLGSERAAQLRRYHDVFRYRMDAGELEGTIFRNAPVVILAHDEKGSASGCENCAIALRNIETLALAMGLGACWVGLFTFAAVRRPGKFNPMLGLAPSRRVYGALMLGYPKYTRRMVIPRRPRHITHL